MPLYEKDMTDFDLGHRFDVVMCLFSSIAYVRTLENMRKAVAAFARHTTAGGLVILEPWFTPQQYWTNTITSNHADTKDLKVTWMYTSRREGSLSVLDIHYLVGTPAGIDYFVEQHRLGLFIAEDYIAALHDAGCEVEYDSSGLFGRGMYIGTRVS